MHLSVPSVRILLTAAALAATPATAHATCPSGYVSFGESGGTRSYASVAVRETSFSVGCQEGSIGWDMTAGTLHFSYEACVGLHGAACGIDDEYTITGVPEGEPLSFEARLRVVGQAHDACGGTGCGIWHTSRIAFADEVDSTMLFIQGGPHSIDVTVRVPITAIAGQSFRVACEVRSLSNVGAGNISSADGLLDFIGLPPGARVGSCHGYAVGSVVARGETWGRVKARYR